MRGRVEPSWSLCRCACGAQRFTEIEATKKEKQTHEQTAKPKAAFSILATSISSRYKECPKHKKAADEELGTLFGSVRHRIMSVSESRHSPPPSECRDCA